MKKCFALTAVLVIALFATSAVAAGPHAFQGSTINQTINLTAQIDQSASLTCPGSVFFDVKNAEVATNGDQDIACTAKVSLHKGGSAYYSVANSTLVGTESGGIIPVNFVWIKTNLSAGYGPTDGGFYPLSYGPTSGATLNHDMNLTFSFQLQPVPTMVPDIYIGTATITLQVI